MYPYLDNLFSHRGQYLPSPTPPVMCASGGGNETNFLCHGEISISAFRSKMSFLLRSARIVHISLIYSMSHSALLHNMISDTTGENILSFYASTGLKEILHHNLPPPCPRCRRRPTLALLVRLCEGGTKISE